VVELPEYEIVDANRAARALLGAAGGGGPEGRPLAAFFSAPAWRRLERLIRPGSESSRGPECHVVRVGGRGGRELEIVSRDEAFGPNRYLVLDARDVTERRRAARALVEARDEAERLGRAKSEFLSIASHELRTPLAALRLRLQQALRSGRADARIEQQLLGPVRRLSDLVDDLLEVSRLERGSFGLNRARIDLRTVVAGVVEEFQSRMSDRRVALAGGAPVPVLADGKRAAQAVSNLLENAVKFSPLESSIEVRVWGDARSAFVAVTDHGPGIPMEDRGRLFTPFSRLPAARTVPGLGLGLYLSRQIARMHGGDIVAGDTPGGGATFTLSIDSPPG
jgi:signal transduction histidine kinase